jgi:hypothetical protein
MGDDDFAAAILIEVRQERIRRSETDRDNDLGLEGAVTVADEDRDGVIVLRSVRVYDIQLPVSVEIAHADSRWVAARGVNDARQEGSVALVDVHANAVARAKDRADEIGPAIAIEVAHLHISWNVVAPVFDLDSILETALCRAVENEGTILV